MPLKEVSWADKLDFYTLRHQRESQARLRSGDNLICLRSCLSCYPLSFYGFHAWLVTMCSSASSLILDPSLSSFESASLFCSLSLFLFPCVGVDLIFACVFVMCLLLLLPEFLATCTLGSPRLDGEGFEGGLEGVLRRASKVNIYILRSISLVHKVLCKYYRQSRC